jgi:hypothetical protein
LPKASSRDLNARPGSRRRPDRATPIL